jgi:hypothetical protein
MAEEEFQHNSAEMTPLIYYFIAKGNKNPKSTPSLGG